MDESGPIRDAAHRLHEPSYDVAPLTGKKYNSPIVNAINLIMRQGRVYGGGVRASVHSVVGSIYIRAKSRRLTSGSGERSIPVQQD